MKIKYENKSCQGIKVLVEQEGKKIGRAYLYILYNDLHQKPFGFLEDVYVDEALRGQGTGKKIVSEVIKKAKEEGCYKLVCTSRHTKEKVHEFYKKIGFKDHGREFRIDFK